jgi:hypothetical protein
VILDAPVSQNATDSVLQQLTEPLLQEAIEIWSSDNGEIAEIVEDLRELIAPLPPSPAAFWLLSAALLTSLWRSRPFRLLGLRCRDSPSPH